ncbi:glycosyltransferase family 1 protein [Sulfurimonas sp. SAG-AH-194-C21]|nr:glycosyltransferase [Sulfurimonas sp. SAG-AH-194-C21]MDF1883739.1 glycosyltransferase family 1 protein [Sulfurimonas sp. SAG-AH-194-C21]
MINNTLILTRISYKNHNSRPETCSVWDAYTNALDTLIENVYTIDYYDLYFKHGHIGFKNEIERSIQDNKIQYLFICYMAEDYTFDLNFLVYLKHKYQLCIINTSQDPETFFEPRDRYYNQIADYILPFAILPNNCIYANYNLASITLYSIYNKDMFYDEKIPKTIDVSFIGNVNKANRREIIDFLKNKGIKIETYGSGSKNGFINHTKMMNIINSSKINLNFTESALSQHFDFNTNTNFPIGTHINSRIQQAKGRLIEIYLTNSFCLSQDGPGTRQLFNNENIVFKDKYDLLKKINYYLANQEETIKITTDLQQLAIKKFDAINRLKTVLPQLKYKSKYINILYVDKEFITNYTSYHFLFFFNFLFKLKLKLALQEVPIFLKYRYFNFNTIYSHLKMQSIYAYKRVRNMQK